MRISYPTNHTGKKKEKTVIISQCLMASEFTARSLFLDPKMLPCKGKASQIGLKE